MGGFPEICAKFQDLHLEVKVHFEEQGRVMPIVAARAKPRRVSKYPTWMKDYAAI